jgi:hypothetical protein
MPSSLCARAQSSHLGRDRLKYQTLFTRSTCCFACLGPHLRGSGPSVDKKGVQCPKCGAFNPDGFASCGICGESLRAGPPSAPTKGATPAPAISAPPALAASVPPAPAPNSTPTSPRSPLPPAQSEAQKQGSVTTGIDPESQNIPMTSQVDSPPQPAVTWPDEAAPPFDWGGRATPTTPPTQGNGPSSPPSPVATGSTSDLAIEQVAIGQKLILYAIVANLATFALTAALGGKAGIFLSLVAVGSLVLTIVGITRLGSGLGYSVAPRVLLIVVAFIPFANLAMLLLTNAQATKALREAGYKVGLMGAQART